MSETWQDTDVVEPSNVLAWVKSVLMDRLVLWDIGQRRRALRAARVQCFLGLLLIMAQVIAHRGYKALRGVEPVFTDRLAKVWLAGGYYITLVLTFVIYASLLRFCSVISGPGDSNVHWWWWRLDARSLRLLLLVAPMWCLAAAGQVTVSLTYPIVYKEVLLRNFAHGMEEYYTSQHVRRFIDTLQETYRCCGFHSYQDWVRLRKILRRGYFPFSCCRRGSTCRSEDITNYLASYKTWYETEEFSVASARAPFKERVESLRNVLYDVPDDDLPFRERGCAEQLLRTNPFYWPLLLDVLQTIVTACAILNIRRYCTGTAFATAAVQPRSRFYTMLNAAHACPCWSLMRPSRLVLWRWQRDYLMQMYFYLVHQGIMRPSEHHAVLYPNVPIDRPDFEKTFNMKVRAYKSFLRFEVGKHKKQPLVREEHFLFG